MSQQVVKDLVEEAERCDLKPKLANALSIQEVVTISHKLLRVFRHRCPLLLPFHVVCPVLCHTAVLKSPRDLTWFTVPLLCVERSAPNRFWNS